MCVSQSSSKTICINCEDKVNAIALSKDASQVVVAGRTVFKIYNIDEDGFEEKCNLRVGKHINLNFCAMDVAWNHADDHILATGATNGAVVIWDLNKSTRSKQEHVFQEHKRTVFRVCFHENEHRLLLSGSQDGFMKLFDTRRKDVSTTFATGSTSIRDIQFCPYNLAYFTFASADDSGNVHIWDMRRPDKVEKQFTAHGGPVFTIDWHPEDRNWFGTAGRDKTIKVWDLAKGKAIHTIQSIASVARIKWRPQRRYHIASCALLVDCSINVWDIRRPYIPFATFDTHKDVTCSIVFKNNDPHVMLSASKDCYLYQHVFRDSLRPADFLVPAGLGVSAHGSIGHANSEVQGKSTNTGSGGGILSVSGLFKKNPDRSDQFINVNSYLHMFEETEPHLALSMSWFVESARRYQLTGRSLEELCDHNASVARDLQRYQVVQSWLMLKKLYCVHKAGSCIQQSHAMSVTSTVCDKADTDKGKQKTDNKPERDQEDTVEGTSGCSDEETSDKEIDKNLTSIARGQMNPDWDIFFGDGEQGSFDVSAIDNPLGNRKQEWVLPNEAFQPRHEIRDRVGPIDTCTNQLHNGLDSPNSTQELDVPTVPTDVWEREIQNISILQADSSALQVPDWSCTSSVIDMLRYFAREGDVQTPVCMLIVLRERIQPYIDELTQENWFFSYIDLLGRFELWTVANEVIKLSNLPQVSMLNQQSTVIHINCNMCSRPLRRTGWLCDRCKAITNVCCICHLPVKGLFLWCQGCSHGGHLQHIKDWFSRCMECPTGCGHLCEYT